ncbi:MAG TPA: histidinol-phosphate transaminase [Gammaproteobacteria bacterium]|nr:histidinol-phosphate transaminase [Gammaproteobacteria bacterium]
MSNNTDSIIQQWVRPEISSLSAYHVTDPADCIKLDAMENPYGWPDEMVSDWQQLLSSARLNRYPDPGAEALVHIIRTAFAIPEDMGLLLGNGSDEIIQMLMMTIAGSGRCVLAPEPAFVMYEMVSRFTGTEFIGIPLQDDFSLNLPAMLTSIEQHQPAIIFLAYPNNPTGNLFQRDEVEQIIKASPGLVILDEAYAAFASDSFMQDLEQYNNLLVMRTVSKMGLAGLRLGYLAGPKDWIREINKVRMPYNINILTQITVEFALRNIDVLTEQTRELTRQRSLLASELQSLPEITVYPSEANFILFRTSAGQADHIHQALQKQHVLIKNLSPTGGALADCLRVTVSTSEENMQFIDALKSCIN